LRLETIKASKLHHLEKHMNKQKIIIVRSRHDTAHLNKMMATKACKSFAMVMITTNIGLHHSNFLHIKNDRREQDNT
jgi:hypothetical protein